MKSYSEESFDIKSVIHVFLDEVLISKAVTHVSLCEPVDLLMIDAAQICKHWDI